MSSYVGTEIGRVSFCPKLLGQCNFVPPVLCQAFEELQFAAYCFASSYWGITICCVKLLKRYGFTPSYWRSAISRFLSCVKLLGSSNLQDIVLPQAIGGLQLAGPCFASTIGEFQVVGLCFAASYREIAIPMLLSRVKLLEIFNLLGFVLRQAIGIFLLAGSCFAPSYWGIAICRLALRQAIGEFQFAGFCLTSS